MCVFVRELSESGVAQPSDPRGANSIERWGNVDSREICFGEHQSSLLRSLHTESHRSSPPNTARWRGSWLICALYVDLALWGCVLSVGAGGDYVSNKSLFALCSVRFGCFVRNKDDYIQGDKELESVNKWEHCKIPVWPIYPHFTWPQTILQIMQGLKRFHNL